jgi:hypothetical protein
LDKDRLLLKLGRLVESLAALEHERWAHWQQYLHGKCDRMDDGSLRIPAGLVHHWEMQIATPYSALPDEERESDREQVRRYLPLIVATLEADDLDANTS